MNTSNLKTAVAALALLEAFPVSLVREVFEERARQDEQWGGPAHDDTHTPADWLVYIDKQVDCARNDAAAAEHSNKPDAQGVADARMRARLVKIAALALAGLASYERKAPPAACKCPACELEKMLNNVGVTVLDGEQAEALLAAILSSARRPGAVN